MPVTALSTLAGIALMLMSVGGTDVREGKAHDVACKDGVFSFTVRAGEVVADAEMDAALADCFPEEDEADLERQRKAWPASLDAAVGILLREMDDESRERIRGMKREELISFHMGWGMGIRNGFGLWGDNEALLLSACGGKRCHPDDASMKIIEAVWERLQQTPPSAAK